MWELILCVYSCKFIRLCYLEIMLTSQIHNSKIGRQRGRILNFGIKEVMVAS